MRMELNQVENWTDITFNQYKHLLKLELEEREPIEKRIEQIAILNPDVSTDDIRSMRMTQMVEYFKTIDFIDKEPVKEILNHINIDGRIFRQISFNNLSLAQWIDAEKFSVDVLDHHQLLAIFYIDPDDYNDIIRERVAEWIDNQPCSRVFYIVSQFFFIQTVLERVLEDYSEEKTRWMKGVERLILNTKRVKAALKAVKFSGSKSSMI